MSTDPLRSLLDSLSTAEADDVPDLPIVADVHSIQRVAGPQLVASCHSATERRVSEDLDVCRGLGKGELGHGDLLIGSAGLSG